MNERTTVPLSFLREHRFACLDENQQAAMPSVDGVELTDGELLEAELESGHWARLRFEKPAHPNLHHAFWMHMSSGAEAWVRLPHGTVVRRVAA